jgi:hypothetical protein
MGLSILIQEDNALDIWLLFNPSSIDLKKFSNNPFCQLMLDLSTPDKISDERALDDSGAMKSSAMRKLP